MSNLLPTDDQQQIIDMVRDFLAAEQPISRFRWAGASAPAPTTPWASLANLGLFGVGASDAAGGMALGVVEETLVMRECGRALLSPSVVATVIGTHLLAISHPSEAAKLVSGERRCAIAIYERPTEADTIQILLCDRADADFVIVMGPAGPAVYPAGALNSERMLPALDTTVSLHDALLPMRSMIWQAAASQFEGLRAVLLISAQLVGLAEAARDLAVDYAKLREQFGRPIGSFQAVKHRCANMAVEVGLAWAQALAAASALGAGADNAALETASALLLSARAAQANAAACIQIHGGIGFQAECDAHNFAKRAHVYDRLSGGLRSYRSAILAEPSPL